MDLESAPRAFRPKWTPVRRWKRVKTKYFSRRLHYSEIVSDGSDKHEFIGCGANFMNGDEIGFGRSLVQAASTDVHFSGARRMSETLRVRPSFPRDLEN